MVTFSLLYSTTADDTVELYSNNSGWINGMTEILAKLHIL